MARVLGTHPFDRRVTSLNLLQVDVLLALRFPPDPEEEQNRALQEDTERKEMEDLYRKGEAKPGEDDEFEEEHVGMMEAQQ